MRTVACLWTIAVILTASLRGEKSFLDYFKLRKALDVLSSTVAELESEKKQLEDEMNNLARSPEYAFRVLKQRSLLLPEEEQALSLLLNPRKDATPAKH